MNFMKTYLFFLCIIFSAYVSAQSQKDQAEKYIRYGQYSNAIQTLKSIPDTIRNDSINRELNYWLENLYLLEKNWNAIIALHKQMKVSDSDTSILTMARLFSKFPEEQIKFTSKAFPIEFKPSMTKTPKISVWVNGHKYTFWVDTGAGMTVLSSKTARDCNIKMSADKNASTTAATGKSLAISYGVIDSLRFGQIEAKNHTCLIIDKKQLEFKIAGIRMFKIDGIIGWNLLQELAVTIHRNPNTILFAPSEKEAVVNPNFFWMSYPLVSCADSSGNPLIFGFDTGAASSSLHNAILSKTDTTKAVHKKEIIGSAGGNVKITTLTFPQIKIFADGKKIVLHNASIHPSSEKGIFAPDGTLGWKELLDYTVYFDFRKGVFRLEN